MITEIFDNIGITKSMVSSMFMPITAVRTRPRRKGCKSVSKRKTIVISAKEQVDILDEAMRNIFK